MRLAVVLLLASLMVAASAQPRQLEAGVRVDSTLSAASDTTVSGLRFVRFAVERTDASPFEVTLASPVFEPYLMLVPPTGERVENGGWAKSAYDARIVVPRGEVGTWYVVATSNPRVSGGAFHIEMQALTAEDVARREHQRQMLLRADSLDRVIWRLYGERRFGEIEGLAEEVLEIRSQALGDTHPDLANALNTLGGLRQVQGQLELACQYLEQSLAIYEAVYPPGHVDIALGLNNLGALHLETGNYRVAERHLRRARDLYMALPDVGDEELGRVLHNLGSVQLELAEYARARDNLMAALRHRTDALGRVHSDVASSLSNLALATKNLGEMASARVLYEQALDMAEATYGPDHLEVATVMSNLGGLLRAQADYATADSLYARALVIREAVLGPNHPDVALTLSGWAGVYKARADYATARRLYERALAIWEAVHGSMHPDVASGLNNLGSLLRVQDDYGGARLLYERALEINEAAFGPDHPEVATTLGNLGLVQQDEGTYAEARSHYERALTIREAMFGSEHAVVARSLNNLAGLLEAQGDDVSARVLYERALAIREATLGPQHPDVAQTLSNLAAVMERQGEIVQARQVFERALAIREAALGPEHPDVGSVLNNLALLLKAQGDFDRARPLFERAIAIDEAVFGPDHLGTATILSNLGLLHEAQGDYASARALFERALEIRRAALGPDHTDVAMSLNNLAIVHYAEGDIDGARERFERVLAIQEVALGPDHASVALALNNLATMLLVQSEVAAARPLYERALAIWESNLGPAHPDVRKGMVNLASLHRLLGDEDAEQAYLMRASQSVEESIDALLPTLASAEQQAFVSLTVVPQVGRLLSTTPQGDALARAYGFIGGWKGLLLREMRRQSAFRQLADDPAYAEDMARLTAIRVEVARAYRQRDSTLGALTRDKEALERTLRAALPADALADPWQAEGLGGLQSRLPPGAAFVDVYRHGAWENRAFLGWQYSAVLTATGTDPVVISLGAAAEIEIALAEWRSAATAGRVADLTELASALWKPIARALPEGATQVWLSPDGDLSRAPWAVLANSMDGPRVAQVPSARALLTLLTTDRQLEEAAGALLVGGVDFGEGASWSPLPGTTTEVSALSELATQQGIETQVFTGSAPTVDAVTGKLADAAFVHLATHGFFFRAPPPSETESRSGLELGLEVEDDASSKATISRNPLAESGLALAGANAGADGLVTAEELVGLDLSGTRLVVLSACETGRGTEVTGQGVLGLQASLTAAGAGAVLMSLWSVPDASTAALMEAFYRGLWQEGRSPAAALELAQAEVRATPGWEAPVHWAAWVLTGDAFTPVR